MKIAVGHRQLTTALDIPQNTCLYGDETRKYGKTYQTFLVSDESQTVYFLGLREMVNKAARTTMNTFLEILNDITDMCQTYKSNHISSGHDILVNIKNFMSDRAQTNIAFCELLEDYRSQILPKCIPTWIELTEDEQKVAVKLNNFLFGLHLLVSFAECISPISF